MIWIESSKWIVYKNTDLPLLDLEREAAEYYTEEQRTAAKINELEDEKRVDL